MPKKQINVGFFVTCLVDAFRPSIAFASIKLLKNNHCTVSIPESQTCCGQPAFNTGDLATSKEIAKKVITDFMPFEYLVAPSGSCLGMIKHHYLELLKDEPEWVEKARDLSDKSYEITSFLEEKLDISIDVSLHANASYHDSCSGLRELNIRVQPRKLLEQVKGLKLIEMKDRDVCCGFGGTFCMKYPEISNSLVSDKVDRIKETGAEYILSGDLGCLMNIAGRCKRLGVTTKCYHVVEVLANMHHQPALGESVNKGQGEL